MIAYVYIYWLPDYLITPLLGHRQHVYDKACPRSCGKPLRLSQMTNDGFYLGGQEGVATAVVAHGTQLVAQGPAARYPAAKGLHGGFGTALGRIQLGKLTLAVRTECKLHVGWNKRVWLVFRMSAHALKGHRSKCKDTQFRWHLQLFGGWFHPNTDKYGHRRTRTDIGHGTGIIFALCFRRHTSIHP